MQRPPEAILDEGEWVNKLHNLKSREDLVEIVVKENIGQVLERLAMEAALYL